MEISAGVYVGHVSARVRELLWLRIVDDIGRGRAIMVHSVRGEQRLSFRVHNHEWEPVDFEGLRLMMRPAAGTTGVAVDRGSRGITDPSARPQAIDRSVPSGSSRSRPTNWSVAARRRRFKREIERRRSEE
jgi:CRISPR-associated protein Cas2